jgi:hypothetical protein
MRAEESELLAQWALGLGLAPGDVCLDIGSSTRQFREVDQPHITERFIRPLEQAGIRFVHCDIKREDGVDEVGDILDPKFRSRLKRYKAKLLVCSSVLEHLANPKELVTNFSELIEEGGYALFSSPQSYPFNSDPIDTMFRPSPDELKQMLPAWPVVKMASLRAGNYWVDLKRSGKPWTRLARHIARVAMPFYRPTKWRDMASRLKWLALNYRISVVLLQKPAMATHSKRRKPS